MTIRHSKQQTHRRIKDTRKPLPRIDAQQVADALGAEPVDSAMFSRGGPLSLFQIRQELSRRLQSTGGRPGLADASHRVKIPLNTGQWNALEAIAKEVASPGFSPSAGQIASVLISLSLRSVRKE
jgi:hypothetical protein